MKIGILGGSFDPIHNGHIHMALAACDGFDLDEVWLIPAGHSPNKDEYSMADADYRYEMCEIAASTDPRIKVSRIELDSDECNYTYITLRKLAVQYPNDHFYFIMGGDSLDYFDRWVYPEVIAKLCTILVMPRMPYHKDKLEATIQKFRKDYEADIQLIDGEEYAVSSTEIRNRISNHNALESDFPKGVLPYIRKHDLYEKKRNIPVSTDAATPKVPPAYQPALSSVRKKIKRALDKDRYEHTKGVMYTAACLAMANDYSVEKAMMAGLLHDCAKCMPTSEKFDFCKKHNMVVSEVERENPGLLHAKIGEILATEKYRVLDPEILRAIRVHTTGTPNMRILDKIIYVADYIEPMRKEAPHLEVIREIAFHNLDEAIAEILYDTLHYLNGRKGAIDPTTQLTYEFYKRYEKERPWKH